MDCEWEACPFILIFYIKGCEIIPNAEAPLLILSYSPGSFVSCRGLEKIASATWEKVLTWICMLNSLQLNLECRKATGYEVGLVPVSICAMSWLCYLGLPLRILTSSSAELETASALGRRREGDLPAAFFSLYVGRDQPIDATHLASYAGGPCLPHLKLCVWSTRLVSFSSREGLSFWLGNGGECASLPVLPMVPQNPRRHVEGVCEG